MQSKTSWVWNALPTFRRSQSHNIQLIIHFALSNHQHMVAPSKALIATYADDIAVIYNSSCHREAANGLQEYLNTLAAWCKRWNLKINPLKTTNPCFTLKTFRSFLEIQLEGVTLDQPSQAKYLGITLDKRLTFGPHLKATVKKCNQRTQQLRWLVSRKSTLPVCPLHSANMALWNTDLGNRSQI